MEDGRPPWRGTVPSQIQDFLTVASWMSWSFFKFFLFLEELSVAAQKCAAFWDLTKMSAHMSVENVKGESGFNDSACRR